MKTVIVRFEHMLETLQLRILIPPQHEPHFTPGSRYLDQMVMGAVKGEFLAHVQDVEKGWYPRQVFRALLTRSVANMRLKGVVVLVEDVPEEHVVNMNLINLTLSHPLYLQCVALGSRLLPERAGVHESASSLPETHFGGRQHSGVRRL